MINKEKFRNMILVVLLFINAPIVIADSKTVTTPELNNWLERRMDLDCNSRSLDEILEDVATFFQTEIVYQTEGASVPIQCRYTLATIEQILDRLFQKKNRAILIEYVPKRKIIVQIFGTSEYNIISDGGVKKTQNLPFLANMTNDALFEMQKEQLKTYHEEMKDLGAIIPGVELTRGEITELHQQQIQQYKKDQNDPDQVVAATTMTQGQLWAIQKQQLIDYEQEKQNQVDPFTGLTTAETIKLHQQQIKLHQQQVQQ
jgi:hypothetical protein